MGYYVEYVIECGIDVALGNLDEISRNSYISIPDSLKNGVLEGNLLGRSLWVNVYSGREITVLCVATIKWSWIVAGDLKSISLIDEYDRLISQLFSGFEVLRVDEYLLEKFTNSDPDDWIDNRHNFALLKSLLQDKNKAQ